MSLAAVVKAMADAGCSAEQIAAAVAAHEADNVTAIKTRREADRDRKRRQRERQSRDVTGMSAECHVTSAMSQDVTGQDPSPKEKSPTPPKEITPTRSSLRSVSQGARESFDQEFWPAYPHKVGKPAAERAFEARFREHDGDIGPIIDGLRRYVAGKPADRPWLNPATFLNQRRYEDRPATPPARAGPREDGMTQLSRKLGSILDDFENPHHDRHETGPANGRTASLFGRADECGGDGGEPRRDPERFGALGGYAGRS